MANAIEYKAHVIVEKALWKQIIKILVVEKKKCCQCTTHQR